MRAAFRLVQFSAAFVLTLGCWGFVVVLQGVPVTIDDD